MLLFSSIPVPIFQLSHLYVGPLQHMRVRWFARPTARLCSCQPRDNDNRNEFSSPAVLSIAPASRTPDAGLLGGVELARRGRPRSRITVLASHIYGTEL